MVKFVLYLLSLLYGFVVFLRNLFYDLGIFKSKEFDVPVISIGNITVGGTGKTPHTEYLVNLLQKNYKVATLSRGYKRKTKGFRYVETTSKVTEVGDEPLQIKKKYPNVIVSVCENRVKGTEQLLADTESQPDVIVLDDAFQHRKITPGINILLIDYNRQIKNDRLLPAGRLRERAHQMKRANIIIFTKCPNEITPIKRRILQKDVQLKPYQELYFTKINYQKIKPVFNAKELSHEYFQKNNPDVLIVSGIANPKPLHNYLQKFAANTQTMVFPDHYRFSANDIQKILTKFDTFSTENKIIVTTEKDAMRFLAIPELNENFKNALYFLPLEIEFVEKEAKSFNKKILSYVGENKSNRELYTRKNKR